MTKKHYSHIIWDWNGTLFDDLDWCFKTINTMLTKRGLCPLPDIRAYQAVFRFPVMDYYRDVGFDFSKEPFEDLAVEYMELYHSEFTGNCRLCPNAHEVLKTIHDKGVKQAVLSASEKNYLLAQMRPFDILQYFDEVLGVDNIYARSKAEIGIKYMLGQETDKTVLIGDTEHDYQVAQILGVDCLLIAKGHHSREQLLSWGVPVLEDISEVLSYIK